MLLDNLTTGNTALSIAFDALVGRDLDGEALELARVRLEQRPNRLVLGIDRHRVGHFHAPRRPGARSRLICGYGPLRACVYQADARDLHFAWSGLESWRG